MDIGENEKEQHLYEVAYILEPSMAEEVMPTEANRVEVAITSHGGVITLADSPKLRELAYTIEKSLGGKRHKYSKGYFGWTKFNATSDAIELIKGDLTGQSTLIRFMIIHATNKVSTSFVRRSSMVRKSTTEATISLDKEAVEAEIDKEVDSLIASATSANVSK